jgi:hypothetical protein
MKRLCTNSFASHFQPVARVASATMFGIVPTVS